MINLKEQFFLKKQFITILRNRLKWYQYNEVIEIGIGTGRFTQCFLKENTKVLAFEIDRSLKYQTLIDKRIKVLYKPFDFKYLKKDSIIISAPPYSLLEEISQHDIKYILMVGERYLKLFKNYKVIYKLKGTAFCPVSRGNHFIITNLNR